MEKLETSQERLSDRELEVAILEKRLELRKGNSKSGLDSSKISISEPCVDCKHKDALIVNLAEKVQLYESILMLKQDHHLEMFTGSGGKVKIILLTIFLLTARLHN